MNFKILHCSQIDIDKWNNYSKINSTDMYNEYNYLNSCTGEDWQSLIWGDYEKVLPFYQKKKWNIIPYICMPPFVQKFDTSCLTNEDLIEAIDFFKKNNFRVDYRVSDSKGLEEFEDKTNFTLDIKERESISFYATLLKKNIQKASNYLEINKSTISEVKEFLYSNKLFQSIVIANNEQAFLKIAQNIPLDIRVTRTKEGNEIVAVLLSVIYRQKVYLIFPYSSDLGRKYQAMSLLIHDIISNSDYEVVDFEGSSIESIANFYQQFGAQTEKYWAMTWKRFF